MDSDDEQKRKTETSFKGVVNIKKVEHEQQLVYDPSNIAMNEETGEYEEELDPLLEQYRTMKRRDSLLCRNIMDKYFAATASTEAEHNNRQNYLDGQRAFNECKLHLFHKIQMPFDIETEISKVDKTPVENEDGDNGRFRYEISVTGKDSPRLRNQHIFCRILEKAGRPRYVIEMVEVRADD